MEKKDRKRKADPLEGGLPKKTAQELGEDQKHVLKAIREGRNVFFTGSAGTGKSYLLTKLVEELPKEGTYVTASTGLAAVNIGGTTLHSFAGIALGTDHVNKLIALNKSRPKNRKRWESARILIIDEISMLSADLWDKIEHLARGVRGNDLPFGGIQLIVCGDFLQLPPVSKRGKGTERFCFQSKSWSRCMTVQIELRQVFRQTNQETVIMLNELRRGICSSSTAALLRSRLMANPDAIPVERGGSADPEAVTKDGVEPTRLYSHNADVDRENQARLRRLPGVENIFEAKDSPKKGPSNLFRNFRAPKRLVLKVGAQVILLKNDGKTGLVNGSRGVVIGFQTQVKRKQEEKEEQKPVSPAAEQKTSNASTASCASASAPEVESRTSRVVTICPPTDGTSIGKRITTTTVITVRTEPIDVSIPGFMEEEPKAKNVESKTSIKDQKAECQEEEEEEPMLKKGETEGNKGDPERKKKEPDYPIVRFACGITKTITRTSWDVKEGDKVIATRSQVPLDLAYSLSIHKSQGMSLDSACISLKEVFEHGQAYVALSRIRSIEGLQLISLDTKRITANPDVVAFYDSFNEGSRANEEEAKVEEEEAETESDAALKSAHTTETTPDTE